jgi:hypothetical protein
MQITLHSLCKRLLVIKWVMRQNRKFITMHGTAHIRYQEKAAMVNDTRKWKWMGQQH